MRPIDVVPDWICKVLSPSNAAHDRVHKRRLYAKHGVAFYWLIDPGERTLEALTFDRAANVWVEVGSYDDTSVARIAPFDAIEIAVTQFFSPRAE